MKFIKLTVNATKSSDFKCSFRWLLFVSEDEQNLAVFGDPVKEGVIHSFQDMHERTGFISEHSIRQRSTRNTEER